MSDGHLHNARFYESLKAKLQPGQRVRDAVSADEALNVLKSVRASQVAAAV